MSLLTIGLGFQKENESLELLTDACGIVSFTGIILDSDELKGTIIQDSFIGFIDTEKDTFITFIALTETMVGIIHD